MRPVRRPFLIIQATLLAFGPLLHAEDRRVWDRGTGRWRTESDSTAQRPSDASGQAQAQAPTAAPGSPAKQLEQAILADPRLAPDQRQMAVDYVRRYGGAMDNADESTQRDLLRTIGDLKNPGKEPALALAKMYDRTNELSRGADASAQVVQRLADRGNKQVTRVFSGTAGQSTLVQEVEKVDDDRAVKTDRKSVV